MALDNIRLEVMNTVEKQVDGFIKEYLIPVEDIWQPTDLLPNLQGENYMDEINQIREEAKELEYDFWVVLVADMVTEEALPTYESWLMDMEGVEQHGKSRGEENAWSKWVRHWTGEENRHGDTLNKYLYLSGRVNMREIEKTTQYLINDGFDIGTGRDPYKNFVYTSFQELATNISHKRVGQLAKKKGKIVIVDPKPSNVENYIGASSMTPNRKEAELCLGNPRKKTIDEIHNTTENRYKS